ncbi:hypothetical protein [Nocardia arizonensis]|uniref:hypothetical protein n=1 Tax=Nocardia arizonensis TaxID=1141647 RepID=UPI0006D234C4|nr:hypothetical protein [Nocardia arizonensis]
MLITKIQIIGGVSDEESISHYTRLLDSVPERPTLATLIRKHGVEGSDNLEIELLDKFQNKQRFSLAPFADVDPDAFIKIRFLSGPAEREFPDLEPGEILLKEYLVAGPED